MTREEMIDALVEDMESWSEAAIRDWAAWSRREDLDALDDDVVQAEYDALPRTGDTK